MQLKSRMLVEPLEERRLLSGLTVITHGYEFYPNQDVSWMDTMAHAIANRVGGADIWQIKINVSGHTESFTEEAGSTPNPANGEVIVEVDWTDCADYLVTPVSTSTVAESVYLEISQNNPYTSQPFTDDPIHLIGHSRGASVMSQLAIDLGGGGITVDQLTTLDPHPITADDPIGIDPLFRDPPVVVPDNVVYADNYYENSNNYYPVDPIPDGEPIQGAANFGPLSLPGGHGIDGGDHADVHTYYFGTIDRSATDDGDGGPINDAWYNGDSRATTGFNYSLIDGGDRSVASAGLSSLAGGSASRTHVEFGSGVKPANVTSLSLEIGSPSSDSGYPIQINYSGSPRKPLIIVCLIETHATREGGSD